MANFDISDFNSRIDKMIDERNSKRNGLPAGTVSALKERYRAGVSLRIIRAGLAEMGIKISHSHLSKLMRSRTRSSDKPRNGGSSN